MTRMHAAKKAAGLPTGGRPGAPNGFTRQLRDAVTATFEGLGGIEAMIAWARENPTSFYSAYLKLLPKEDAAKDRSSGVQVIVQGSAQLRDAARGVVIDATPDPLEENDPLL